MKRSTGKKPTPRVALLIESSRSYGRELLMGIARYVRIHGPWSIEFEEGDPGEQFPKWFALWKWDGIIARISTPEIAEVIRRTGVPAVDLSGILPEAGFPQIRSDERAVGSMAAEHLLERGFKNFAFCASMARIGRICAGPASSGGFRRPGSLATFLKIPAPCSRFRLQTTRSAARGTSGN